MPTTSTTQKTLTRWQARARHAAKSLPHAALIDHIRIIEIAIVVVFCCATLVLMIFLLVLQPETIATETMPEYSLNEEAMANIEEWMQDREEERTRTYSQKTNPYFVLPTPQ